jgi:hypothetical protein
MKCKTFAFCLISLLLGQIHLLAQDKLDIKFGKINPADFDLSKHSFDSSSAAVVLADIGNTYFEGNGNGSFTLVFKRLRRVKILTKAGFEAAQDEILVYSNGAGREEQLTDLKASTYNLENGQVQETKLDGKSIFTDKQDRYMALKKFTFPAVKEGSIIEESYTIRSDFRQYLRAWNFQCEYPTLWSEYEVKIPEFFNYVFLTQGDQNYHIKTVKNTADLYTVRWSNGTSSDDVEHLQANVQDSRWVKKDVPALRDEEYCTTLKNHVARIEFQLNFTQYGETGERHVWLGDWFMASDKLLKDEDFGGALGEDNRWMNQELQAVLAGAQTDEGKAQKIYGYLRDNFTSSGQMGIYTDHPLKAVFKSRGGSVAEINLLLVAICRHENIAADPALLSTRGHGYTSETYPLISRFNYVVCAIKQGEKTIFLDASDPNLGFGCLPGYCYNGQVRVINISNPYLIHLYADSLKERKMTSVVIVNDDKEFLAGSCQSTLGNIESINLRDLVRAKGEKSVFQRAMSELGADGSLENEGIDSLSKLEYPVKVHFDFNLKVDTDQDMLYINPILADPIKDNPFKAAQRLFPVEMPYAQDFIYVLSMEIPKGYELEELPKSARVAFNNTEGIFEYLVQHDENGIQLRTHLRLDRAFYAPDEYGTLRDFYTYVVKKEAEQIVFKKKK